MLSAILLLGQSGIVLHGLLIDHAAVEHQECEICLSISGSDTASSNQQLSLIAPVWLNADKLLQPVYIISSQLAYSYRSRAPPLV